MVFSTFTFVPLVICWLCLSIRRLLTLVYCLIIDPKEVFNGKFTWRYIYTLSFYASIALGSVEIKKRQKNVQAGYRRTSYFIVYCRNHYAAYSTGGGNCFTSFIFTTGGVNYGVEFFVEGEPASNCICQQEVIFHLQRKIS